MFDSIRRTIKKWFFPESHTEEELPTRKRHCDDAVFTRFKRRCLESDIYPNNISSDQFLCPSRSLGFGTRMASTRLFSVVKNTAGEIHQYRQRSQNSESKEDIEIISDDEGEAEKSTEAKLKPKEVQWRVPKLCSKSKFLNHHELQKDKDLDSEVQFIKAVEAPPHRGKCGGIIESPRSVPSQSIKRKPILETKRDIYHQYLKSKSTSQLPATVKPPPRQNSLNESIRLDEKRKYHELLQKYTHVPLVSPSRCEMLRLGDHESKLSFTADNIQSPFTKTVDLIDLTQVKHKDMSRNQCSPHLEKETEEKQCPLANDIPVIKSEVKNSLELKMKENPLYAGSWATDLSLMFDQKWRHSQRQMEQAKQRLALSRKKSQEAIQETLGEKIRRHMKLTDMAVEEEVIILEDEEELKLPSLTPHMEKIINAAFRRDPPGEVLVEAFNLRITRRDIHTLTGSNWLNDEVINFYMNLLIERGKQDKYPSMYGFNTFFYPKLASGGHASLKRWTRKIDIFTHEILIVPVHLGVHWCMASINLKKKTIDYYDSMGGANNSCLRDLMKYLQEESLDKKKVAFDTTGWTAVNVQEIPQQMNGSDCGMFACMYAEFICRNAKISFTQADMPYFRRKMAYEILTKKLLL